MENELYHHGIKGQKWGVRRFESASGHLTSAGKKRYSDDKIAKKAAKEAAKKERIINSGSAKQILKNRKYLSDDEFNKAYDKAYKIDQLQKMNNSSAGHEIAVHVGKQAASTALKVGLATATVVYLTKTNSGQQLVSAGKTAAMNFMKQAAANTAKTSVDVTKTVAKAAASTVTKAATDKRASDVANFAKNVQKGNTAAKALYKYGKAMDKIVGR